MTFKNAKTPAAVIYVGPSLGHGRLQFAQVFINGFPPGVQALLNQYPWFGTLFVAVPDFAAACKRTRVKGDLLNIYYNKAKEV